MVEVTKKRGFSQRVYPRPITSAWYLGVYNRGTGSIYGSQFGTYDVAALGTNGKFYTQHHGERTRSAIGARREFRAGRKMSRREIINHAPSLVDLIEGLRDAEKRVGP